MVRTRKTGRRWRWLGRAMLAAVLLLLASSLYVEYRYRAHIHTLASAPHAPVALVFGAGLTGELPSRMLAERLDTAVGLYKSGHVEEILLSGNSAPYHDEVGVMRRYVLQAGVPDKALRLDGQGESTFDSCARAHQMLPRTPLLLVTQRFHLPRALFIARSIGVDAEGVASDGERPRSAPYPWRELLARPLAVGRVFGYWLEASPPHT